MTRAFGLTVLLIAAVGSAFAGSISTPEIDPSTGVAALALLSGGLLVLKARRKK